jgi:malonate-semialdehyde dehydrogenase (acetylating)/methylmalonate-semialdehyde dehydrogenase
MREISHKLAFTHDAPATRYSDVFDPNNGGVQARVALGDAALLDLAVAAAKKAQPAWAAVNPQRRARVMFNFKALVEANMNELAHLLSSEHGKVIADSKGDIQSGIMPGKLKGVMPAPMPIGWRKL